MRPLAIVNPNSKGGKTGKFWPEIKSKIKSAIGSIDVHFTKHRSDATVIARASLHQGYTWLIAVGGDGTVNEIVNGYFENGTPINIEGKISLVMRGTGNDFRRSTSKSLSLEGDIAALKNGKEHLLDVGKVTCLDSAGNRQERYFDNIASFGMGGNVNIKVSASHLGRFMGGTGAYFTAMFLTMFHYRNKPVTLKYNGVSEERKKIRYVGVCNGKYAGGNMCFAPKARLNDGLFDVVVLGDINLFGLVRNFQGICNGTFFVSDSPEVGFRQCKQVVASSTEDVLVEADGEVLGKLPATFTIVPKAIKFHY
jgi:YegS/Rv2252/BmrU family lipid kinase